MAKIETLEMEVQALRNTNEQLELENRTIRKGMSNCCIDSEFVLEAEQSFLLQNTPNPFQNSTKVQFFVPADVQGNIQIRNLMGILLQSFDIENGGLGEVTVEAKSLAVGTYIYSLTIEGKLIDSKVMILTK